MSTLPVVVRPAVPADLPVLDRELPTGRDDIHAAFLARQAVGDAAYLVGWQGHLPVGTGVVRWSGAAGLPEITNLQVPPERQGQGIGTALVRAAEALIRAAGHPRAAIGVGEDNPRAAALYARLGYQDSGHRQTTTYRYHDDTGVEREATEHNRTLTRDLVD